MLRLGYYHGFTSKKNTNLNEKMVREGYAEVMYVPPSEFDPYEWV